ncbi:MULTISPECIES: GntR family transcriptional regulator [Chitinophaga]|uniref:GntR family transcriptional regulator n=1 Tax=Chitinophaga TaxID=79328 RepID=UPI0009C51BC7|nr:MULTISPECIES: GntR family transcriptional regulator [Chitinophaga]OMP81067.1 GntR family transcriptional regulator [[Flexibacter] sp. ATCC 35208]WPQ63227.1 GntR family transcriptional regulator [Chitinophaga sancti]WPV67718.1 GntR family transcriptional regulator [Chitinophaga sp. LS1]
MEFKESQAIYLQIADHICEQILLEKWKAEDRLPSVRELAVQTEVNPNTVMRTCEYLQQYEIIYNKRGIGYFVASDAMKRIKQLKKERFMENELPQFFRNIYLLDIELDELKTHYEKYKRSHFR